MFSLEQLQQLIKWSKELNVYDALITGLKKEKIISNPDKKLTLNDQECVDEGLDWALLLGALEHIIPASSQVANNKDKYLSFLKLIIIELMKASQSICALLSIIESYNSSLDIHAKEVITSWHKLLNELILNIFTIINANKNKKALSLTFLENYKNLLFQFKHQSLNLRKIHGEIVEISEVVISQIQTSCHDTFIVLGLKRNKEIDQENQNKVNITGNQETETAIPKINATQSSNKTETLSYNHSLSNQHIPRRKLEQSFNTLCYQQYVLSGHNLIFSLSRPEKYVSQQEKYAEQLSAVLLSQQMILSDRYIDQMTQKSIEELEETFYLTDNNIENNLSKILTNTLTSIEMNDRDLTSQELTTTLCENIASELTNASPNLAGLLISLNKRNDTQIVGQLGEILSSGLDDIFTKLPPKLQEILPKDTIAKSLKNITSADWVSQIETIFIKSQSGFNRILDSFSSNGFENIFKENNFLKMAENTLGDIFKGSDFLNTAKDLLNNIVEGGGQAIWKQLSGGLAGGTFADFSKDAIGAAINQFLPTVTHEIFGNNDLGNTVSGAIGAAMTGFSVGGPIGALVGVGLSFIPSLFGGDDAEARAKAEQQQAQKMQSMMQAISNDIKIYTGACFERLDQRMMHRFEDVQKQLVAISNDLHEHMDKLGVHIDRGFEAVLDGIDGLAQVIDKKSREIHAHIDHLAKYNEYRFDRLENTIYKVGDFLYQGIRDLHDLHNTRLDRLEVILQREFNSLHRNLEKQFSQQKDFLLKLLEGQEGLKRIIGIINEESIVRLDLLERILRSVRQEQAYNHERVKEIFDSINYRDFNNDRSLSLTPDVENNSEKARKYLLKFKNFAIVEDSSSIQEKTLIQWGEGAKIYLDLLYRNPSLWNEEIIQKYTTEIFTKGLKYLQEIYFSPIKLSQWLSNYQRTIYDLYHEIINEYIELLQDKKNTTHTKFEDWNIFKKTENYNPELDYNFGPYAVRLHSKLDKSKTRLLDIITKNDSTIWFYAEEANNIIIRRFDLSKVIERVRDIGKHENKLLSYPVIFSDYREVSIIDTTARKSETASYQNYYNKWRNSKNSFACSSHEYAIRCCDDTVGAKIIYLWHPAYDSSHILITEDMGRIVAFDASIRRGELVAVFITQSNKQTNTMPVSQVWMGKWKLSSNNIEVIIPCKPYQLLENLIQVSNKGIHLLREWNGWYVLANQFLVHPKTLQLKSFSTAESFCHYDSNTSRVRLLSIFENNKNVDDSKSLGIYYDFDEECFKPVPHPLSDASANDFHLWHFNSDSLTLTWPLDEEIALRENSLSNQVCLGSYDNYAIYCSVNEGKVLLLKYFSVNERNSIQQIIKTTAQKLWEKEKSNIKKNFIDILEGVLPHEKVNTLSNKLRAIAKEYKNFELNFKQLFYPEIQKNPDLKLLLELAFSGFKQLTGNEEYESLLSYQTDKLIPWVRNTMQGCYGLQQHLLAKLKSSEAQRNYPILISSLEAFKRLSVVQDINLPDFTLNLLSNNFLLERCAQAIGLGISFKLKLVDTDRVLVLDIKIFGKSWLEFYQKDRLFMERFREEGQHEHAIKEFLDALEMWFCQQDWHENTKLNLSKEFFLDPTSLVLYRAEPNLIKEICKALKSVVEFSITTTEISKKYETRRLSYMFAPNLPQVTQAVSDIDDDLERSSCILGMM